MNIDPEHMIPSSKLDEVPISDVEFRAALLAARPARDHSPGTRNIEMLNDLLSGASKRVVPPTDTT